jgi:hypothetical protein
MFPVRVVPLPDRLSSRQSGGKGPPRTDPVQTPTGESSSADREEAPSVQPAALLNPRLEFQS